MAIRSDKRRLTISLELDLINALKQEADKNRRFVSDEVAILIQEHLMTKKKNND